METNIKISILIPVYKAEQYIERCVASIISQSITEEIEVIIVNDCTPDASMKVLSETLKSYPVKPSFTIKIINHDKNRGQAAARNTALENATGIYTLFIDSDDYIDTDMVAHMYIKAIETDADIVMVDLIKEYNDRTDFIKAPYHKDKGTTISHFIRGESIYLCNKLIRKSLYDKNKLSFREGHNMSEDYTIMIPLSFAANRIEYVPDTYYHYIQYNTSATTKRRITQNEINGWLYSVERAENYIKENRIQGYELDIIYRKLIVRYWCMKSTTGIEREKYSKLYPEINAHSIYLTKQFGGKRNKLLFYLVAKGYINSFNLLSKFNIIKLI